MLNGVKLSGAAQAASPVWKDVCERATTSYRRCKPAGLVS
jgi:hypothetical protein